MRSYCLHRVFICFAALALMHASALGHGGDYKIIVPATAAETWSAINGLQQRLEKTIAAGELGKVHDLEEAMTELLKALPRQSKEIPPRDRFKIQGQINNVVKTLQQMHVAADEGRQAETQSLFKTATQLLKNIAAVYPEGTTTGVTDADKVMQKQ